MVLGKAIFQGFDLMIKGMFGVFVVVGIIYLTMKVLANFDKKNKK